LHTRRHHIAGWRHVRSNLTIVLVEQNLDFIAAVSQRVTVTHEQISGEIPPEHLGDLDMMNQYAGVHV
jgi:ABC-type branched-subunit amino acid transport system ATPase component